MSKHNPWRFPALSIAMAAVVLAAGRPTLAQSNQLRPGSIVHKVERASERLEMTANTSRILVLDKRIPRAQVNNPEILDLTPLAASKVQVSAKKPGVTQVNLWTEDEEIYTIDVVILGDARELKMMLESQFPHAALRVVPVGSSVLVSGYVDQPEHVKLIEDICSDFYPKVINNITVGGVQQVLLHVKVMEVSRTKLRQLGFDWTQVSGSNIVASTVSGLIAGVSGGAVATAGTETFFFNVIDGNNAFFGVLDALRQDNLLKVLAEPTLVTVSGRPAYFLEGGQIPIIVPQSLGTVSIEYKNFGTQVDFVPIVLGNGRIRLEVRPRVSELDSANGVDINSVNVPGIKIREVDTGVEMKAGQTLAIAGLLQTRIEARRRGLPWVSEVPYLGTMFRKVEEVKNEVELLILVTPELVDPMNPGQVPQCGPGMRTTSPGDCELYFEGHLEVPNCCPTGEYGPVEGMGPQPTPAAPGQAPVQTLGYRGTPMGSRRPGNPYSPSRQSVPTPVGPPGSSGGPPGFIGPLGYDVGN